MLFYDVNGVERMRLYGTNVGIGKSPAYMLDVAGDINVDSGKVLRVNAVQIVGARIIDARIDDTINSGDATTDGVIDALRTWAQTWGAVMPS
jgi:hypothetical protein